MSSFNNFFFFKIGKPAPEVIGDAEWLKTVFLPTVQKRGATVIAARKISSAMSVAKAASDHMKSIWTGTPSGMSGCFLSKMMIFYRAVVGF